MRPSRRTLSLLRAIFVFSILVPSARTPHAQSVQTLPDQVPPTWSEAVRALIDRIAAASSAHATLAIHLKNLSSLSALDANHIREAVQAESTRGGFRIASAPAAGTEVWLTLSEGIDSYIWVAEWQGKQGPQVAIVAVPKISRTQNNETKGSVALESKLVWQQPTPLLDFAVVKHPATVSSTLVTLEPGRLVFYSFTDSRWQFSNAMDIPHSKPWPRDVRGAIDVNGGKVQLPDVGCTVDIENAKEIRCAPWKGSVPRQASGIHVSGHEESESALLGDRCDGNSVVLVSGNGDWTQPDLLQGYMLSESGGQAIASGSPVEFDGPVMSLNPGANQSAVEAVVHSLKTGNYEAYIVTATCSH
jgi:hypothetical protein